MTNNSTKTRQQVVEKFHGLGLTWVRAEDVLTSAYAAAMLVEEQLCIPKDKKIYVVGHEGIVDELQRCGYTCVGSDAHAKLEPDLKQGVQVDADIGAVVVGFDLHFNYYKMVYASQCVLTLPGCAFVATNTDALAHVTPDAEWPGGGTMVHALRHAIGRDPIVAGKPSDFLVDLLYHHHLTWNAQHLLPPTAQPAANENEQQAGQAGQQQQDQKQEQVLCDKIPKRDKALAAQELGKMCMVGDRLDTDIVFGHQAGMKTLLVFSGVTGPDRLDAELERLQTPKPHFLADSLASLLPSQ